MSIFRRDFIRIAGGALALAAVPGCGAWKVPESATEAWRGPSEKADARLRALGWALLAPSAHNLQSWVVDLSRPGALTLSVDTTRLLPATDPPGRQITISQGTFLELLDLALRAQGLLGHAELFPEDEYAGVPDGRPVARIHLERTAGLASDPLFDEVPRRRTNRLQFEEKEVAPADLIELLRTPIPAPVAVAGTVEPRLRAVVSELADRAFELEVRTPRTWRESVVLTRIGAAEIDRFRDGVSVTGFLPWMAQRLGQTTAAKMMDPEGSSVKLAIAMGHDQASSARAWVWISTPGNTRRDQVAAGRAYLRLHLAATRLGLAWQPMSQLLQEYSEMAELQGRLRAALGFAPGGATIQMLARLGHAPSVAPAPRRALRSLVRGG